MSEPLLFGSGLRLLAIVQLVAFHSLWRDVPGIAGSRGLQPVAEVLAASRRDYGWRSFLYFPSLLHFASSDRALRGWIALGATASVLVLIGGPWTPWALTVSWAVYLSYDVAVDLLYPWDSMLLEGGLLAILAPPLALLPSLALEAPAHPMLVWAFRFLAFRVVLGFGKYKFFGPGTLDTGYLASFLVTQPMPRPLALRLQRLPLPVHQAALAGLFVVEVLSPWLWLGGGAWRWVPTALVAALMLAIQLTGNFGFFNIGMIALAVIAATSTPSAFDLALARPDFVLDAPHLAAAALLLLGLCHLPFHSWVSRSWMYWPDLERTLPRVLRPLLWAVRALAPFRVAHAYGVFGPECGPRGQWVPVVEASLDGESFEPYRYRHYPSDVDFRGTSISPAFPRFDHALIYEAMGLGLGNLMGAVVGGANPYRTTRALFLERVQRRLLEGSLEVRALFGHAPFEGATPRAVRVSFRFQAFREDAAPSEALYRALPLGLHLPSRTLRDAEPIAVPRPCQFLPDDRVWLERARGARARASSPRLVDFPSVPASIDAALAIGERDRDAMRALEPALFEAARARMQGAQHPSNATQSELATWLCALSAAAHGGRPLDRATVDEGLAVLAMLRPSWVRFHVRKASLRSATLRGAGREPPSFAPGILRLLPKLAASDTEAASVPRFVRRPARGWALDVDPSAHRA